MPTILLYAIVTDSLTVAVIVPAVLLINVIVTDSLIVAVIVPAVLLVNVILTDYLIVAVIWPAALVNVSVVDCCCYCASSMSLYNCN